MISLPKYVIKSLWHYRKLNVTVLLGVALSTAILLGALIIGDSVRNSLKQITLQRLGRTEHVVTAGDRLFRKLLATELSLETGLATTPLLRSEGICVIDGGKSQFNQLAVWGVDSTLGSFSTNPESFVLNGNEAAINEHFAAISGLKTGDEFLLRVKALNTFPANTPFVSAAEATVSFRIRVAKILKPTELGNLNLQNIQSSPRNLFLNLDWMNRQMKLNQKANAILVSKGSDVNKLSASLQRCWKPEDLSLKIREDKVLNYTELTSDRVFVEPSIEQFCIANVRDAKPLFSYFINDFSFGEKHTPYSFISTTEDLKNQEILVSEWLAEDLQIKKSDTITLNYFEVGPLRKLVQKDCRFVVKDIFHPAGKLSDPNLMPIIPGLSDAGNCRDWKTGVPVDLKKIRAKDEAYWKSFKGTPKAFVSLQTAQKLWGNRFGQSTAIRMDGTKGTELEKSLLSGLKPEQAGIGVTSLKTEGLFAATGGVDFGQLFIGLSFFVLLAALLLTYLLTRLSLTYRKNELNTLSSLGFTNRSIRKLVFAEMLILTLAGILMGIPFAILYDSILLQAINTIWNDIVRASIAEIDIQPASVVWSAVTVLLISAIFIHFILNQLLKRSVTRPKPAKRKTILRPAYLSLFISLVLFIFAGVVLFIYGFGQGAIQPQFFYISGLCVLPGILFLLDFSLRRIAVYESVAAFSFRTLVLKSIAADRNRTLMAVGFLSIGIFLVVSTGLNRKEIAQYPELPSSGTGGFTYFVETTLPLLYDANSQQAINELSLPPGTVAASFQVQPGDDASCLNLNKIARPRIIACNPALFDQRSSFSFVTHTEELSTEHPWLSLHKILPDNTLPAFADQTAILWGMGKKIGDTLIYKNEAGKQLNLKLIGGFANSVFQGNVIVAGDYFVKEFPSVSGANLFLLQTPKGYIPDRDFLDGWRHYGAEITGTRERLLMFGKIETTYLNIFLMLGALGLLIGTIGLGILIYRITLEQIPQYALLHSIGFSKARIFKLLFFEKLFLLLSAIFAGSIPAALSVAPIIFTGQNSNLWLWLPVTVTLVLVSGFLSIYLAIRNVVQKNLIRSLDEDLLSR